MAKKSKTPTMYAGTAFDIIEDIDEAYTTADSGKLNITHEMARLDQKDREFYDSLDDDEKKKFSTFLMIRWGSCVSGDADLQTYYLQMTNKRLNKNFFAIKKEGEAKFHDKLNWLTATTISPGAGNMRHNWIANKKKENSNPKVRKFFAAFYPGMKDADLDLLAAMNDVKDVKKFAEELGWTKEQIKKELS